MRKVLYIAILLFSACNNNKATTKNITSNNKAEEVTVDSCKNNIAELSQHINLPKGVISATYKINTLGNGEFGPSDKVLVATLQITDSLKTALLNAKTIQQKVGIPKNITNCLSKKQLKNFSTANSNKNMLVLNAAAYKTNMFNKNSFSNEYYFIDTKNQTEVFIYMSTH